jgi:hypothetical protein
MVLEVQGHAAHSGENAHAWVMNVFIWWKRPNLAVRRILEKLHLGSATGRHTSEEFSVCRSVWPKHGGNPQSALDEHVQHRNSSAIPQGQDV